MNKALIPELGTGFGISAVLFVSVMLSVAWLAFEKKLSALKPHHARFLTANTLIMVVGNVAFLYALPRMPLVDVFIIILTTPAFATLVAWALLRESLTPRQLMGFVVAVLACLVALEVWQGFSLDRFSKYDPAALAALALHVFCFSLRPALVRKFGQKEHPLVLSIYGTFFTVVALLLFFTPVVPETITLMQGGMILVSSTCVTLGLGLMFMGFKMGPANLTAGAQYTQMIWSTLFGWLFFAEVPSPASSLAAMMMIISGALLFWPTRNKHVRHHSPSDA
ncbi:MAG: DMT family transporter [Alphaproteobacteria bacterium]|nr:DMT family transporter [Alphaproteobacteria bacterium]